jgi:hypothetical protein
MINISKEKLLSLRDAAQLLPRSRNGRPTHPSTILRWILHGLRGRKLEGARLGGRWITSAEALERFVSPAEGGGGGVATAQGRPSAEAATDRELDALGL